MKKLDGTITLSLLDEDNSQRVIFRIFPLCTKDGLIFNNRKQSYPDFGSLRIIPDKREQSSFKERMREIGPLCCVQLTSDGKELTKVRQNRNYDPKQDECNQFAIYSDVICGFEPESVFEVYQENQPFSQALTENVLIQRGMILYGPISRDAVVEWDGLKPFGNENFLMHTIEDVEGNPRTYYWNPEAIVTWRQRKRELKRGNAPKEDPEQLPETAELVQPEAQQVPVINEDPIPIGTKLEILDEDLTTQEHITELNRPVSIDANRLAEAPLPPASDEPKEAPKFHGTPITDAQANGHKTHNGNGFVHDVVEKQIKEKQQNGGAVRSGHRPVVNPLENLREALRHVWSIPSLHQDLLRLLGENKELSQAVMDSPMMNSQAKSAYSAIKAELDEIEGQRISLLVELDKVKENYQHIKEKMYLELAEQKQKEIHALNNRLLSLTDQCMAAEETLKELGESIRTGTLKLLAKAAVDTQTNGTDIVLSPTIGVYTENKALVETVRSIMSGVGFMCKQDCVTEFMVFLSLHDEICVTAETLSLAELYVKHIIRALGLINVTAWPQDDGNLRLVSLLPENDQRTPTIEVIRSNRKPIRAYGHKTIRLIETKDFEAAGSLPVLRIPKFNRNRGQENLNFIGNPVSLRSIHAFSDRADLLYKDGEGWLLDLRKKLITQGIEIPSDISLAAFTFVRAAAPQLNGGLMEALDTAALVWIVPKLVLWKYPKERLHDIIGDLPKCMQFMAETEY
ncbi:MAG TPA: hypothetical protein PKU80_05335 [Candidatus Limiplasma sp.]|nr:hypothetical protein [Candidatus Limiplasma sp.]HRX07939.1 hypothetical protein [Candidatus Limiplasma sp.]